MRPVRNNRVSRRHPLLKSRLLEVLACASGVGSLFYNRVGLLCQPGATAYLEGVRSLKIVVFPCHDALGVVAGSPCPMCLHIGLSGGETPHLGLLINSITECVHAGFLFRVSVEVWLVFHLNYDH